MNLICSFKSIKTRARATHSFRLHHLFQIHCISIGIRNQFDYFYKLRQQQQQQQKKGREWADVERFTSNNFVIVLWLSLDTVHIKKNLKKGMNVDCDYTPLSQDNKKTFFLNTKWKKKRKRIHHGRWLNEQELMPAHWQTLMCRGVNICIWNASNDAKIHSEC